MSIDSGPIASAFQLLRDKLNGQLSTSDLATAKAVNFARPRYNRLLNRLDTSQGFHIARGQTCGPAPDTSWVLVDGTHKAGDLFESHTTPDHLDVALYGQTEWHWVPGATVRFYVPFDCDVRVQIEADVVVPKNATLARTVQLGTMGGPQLQVPSYSAMFSVLEGGAVRAPDQASQAEPHFLEPTNYGLFTGTPKSLPGEPTPQPAQTPESPFWYRRRHTSTRLSAADGGRWYTWGLRINPRADRVYVGTRSIHVEAIYS